MVKSSTEGHDMILIAGAFEALIYQGLHALPGFFGSRVLGVEFHNREFHLGWHLSTVFDPYRLGSFNIDD